MKNYLLKKALAVTMSAAMALSMLSFSDRTVVSAKAPFVKLNTTFKTLTVGQTYKLKLKNNTLGWKVKKAVSKDGTICEAANKKSYVKLTAKGEGRTTIRVTLKTAKRKGAGAVKKLSCRVNVKTVKVPVIPEVPVTPVEPEAPVTDITVSDQAGLTAALADANIKTITVRTDAEESFVISSGNYKNVDIIVDAPKADVDNSGVFKSVTIKAVKDNTWIEKAEGNAIRVEAVKTRIVVEQGAVVPNISFVTANADVRLEVKGSVSAIDIDAKMSVEISGSTAQRIPVTVDAAAADTVLKSSAPVKVTTAANISVTFQKGAEDSSVELTKPTISIAVDTAVKIEVTKADGTKQEISANQKTTVTSTQPVTTPSSGNTGYYDGSGSSSGNTGSSGNAGSSGNTGNTGSQTGKPAFEEGYPKIDVNGSELTVMYKLKNVNAGNPAEIYNVISTINTFVETDAVSVMHGHLGTYTADYHQKTDPTLIDYLRITDQNEHSCKYDLDVYGGGFNINEGLAVYSVIKGDEGSLAENKIEPQNYTFQSAPRAQVAYHNQAKDKVYVYFSKNLDEASVPAKECFTITSQNAETVAVVSGVSIAANPNNDHFGNYIVLEMNGTVAEGSKLFYKKPEASAGIQDTEQKRNVTEDFEIDIIAAEPKITDVKVSADHKYMTLSLSPVNAGNDFLDIFINGTNLNVNAGFGTINFNERVISLADLSIDENTEIQSVEIKAKDGKKLVDRAFDDCDSIKYEGTVSEVAAAGIVSAVYSKSEKVLKIQTVGTDYELSQLFGCDMVLKINGTEYELRGKFRKHSQDGIVSDSYTSRENALEHLNIPEDVEIGEILGYLTYDTKLTEDQFGDGRAKGVLTDLAGKPLLAIPNAIEVTIVE